MEVWKKNSIRESLLRSTRRTEKALWCCEHTNKIIFMGAILLFGMLAFVNFRIRNNPFLIHVCACMFMTFYLGVGILAAIGEGSIQERTGSGNTKIK